MDFFDTLFASRLPVPVWSLALLWLLLHAASIVLVHLGQWQLRRQSFLVVATAEPPVLSVRLVVLQLAGAAYCFGVSQWMGGRMAAFLGGGFFIMTALGFAANLRNFLVLRRRETQGGLEGRLVMTRSLAFHECAADLGARALSCVAILLLAPHIALVGGAFFVGIAAIKAAVKANELAYRDGPASVKAGETPVP